MNYILKSVLYLSLKQRTFFTEFNDNIENNYGRPIVLHNSHCIWSSKSYFSSLHSVECIFFKLWSTLFFEFLNIVIKLGNIWKNVKANVLINVNCEFCGLYVLISLQGTQAYIKYKLSERYYSYYAHKTLTYILCYFLHIYLIIGWIDLYNISLT